MKELLIATTNRGKVRELERLLAGLPVRLRLLSEFPHAAEPVEDGRTFAENALLKARHYAAATGLLTLSDDSGLAVDALGGEPGVHSARFGGATATYPERMALLLERLAAAGGGPRTARFVCVIALADPATAETHTFEGVCKGRIADEPRGSGGFGYDPLFVPEGHDRTFGELPEEVKQEISHRARALRLAARFLTSHLKPQAV
ncbi:MAG TPA: RdgB/HAM1 family non-canonical purine NTP pyrophosphatase [Pyrinomonadaceae bacterium]|nr:RdgB/HAM1 family non-canonical purine NTP pyrophosphatase [Pyrinomonadaceae bacterium]